MIASVESFEMKSTLVLFLLINTLLDCTPINTSIGSLLFNFTRASDNEVIDVDGVSISNVSKNFDRIAMPQDVELIDTVTRNQQQQTSRPAIPVVRSIIDLIFAASPIKFVPNFHHSNLLFPRRFSVNRISNSFFK